MLRAMNQVMRLQREQVKDDPVLLAAWRQGNAYWKDHFGAAAAKELLGCLRSAQLGGAARAGAALIRFVGFRILVLPWKRRRRILNLLRQRPGVSQKAAPIHPVIPITAGRKEQAPASKS